MSSLLRRTLLIATALVSGLLPSGHLEAGSSAPRELGQVNWGRDLDLALERAQQTRKPIFALFQEVPGCSTCVGFGDTVLSHPLLVEAIEEEFVAVAIMNNKGGKDAAVLARYGEPSWNNPVVRFFDAKGQDLIERRAGLYTPHAIAARMVQSLEIGRHPVPRYLALAEEETRSRVHDKATFGMHCYWQGEACMGREAGIVASRAGMLNGREVVELTFDPRATDYASLVADVHARGCADSVFAHDAEQLGIAKRIFAGRASLAARVARPASDSDQKYYLKRSALRSLDLTPLQATRVNAALGRGGDPLEWLSPRQRAEAEVLSRRGG